MNMTTHRAASAAAMSRAHVGKANTAQSAGQADTRTGTSTDVIEITPKIAASWRKPYFQRDVTVNAKVTAAAAEIRESGVIPGVICLGVIGSEVFLVDGQHRIAAFNMADIGVAYADVRYIHATDQDELAAHYEQLNAQLVTMRPDDKLKALSKRLPSLRKILAKCDFVGFGLIRKKDESETLSMSAVVRSWVGSATEIPSASGNSVEHAKVMSEEDGDDCAAALNLLKSAWGRDPEYTRLWNRLNLTVCLWLYRRVVMSRIDGSGKRATPMSGELFRKAMASLATKDYAEWLRGRGLNEYDRAPAYRRVKALVVSTVKDVTGKAPFMPAAAWLSGGGNVN